MTRSLCFLLLALWVPGAFSQVTPVDRHQAVRATLHPDAQARIVLPEAGPFTLASVRAGGIRTDPASGVVRADYRIATRLALPGADAEAAARRYLSAHAARYGLDPALTDLQTERVTSGVYSHHVVFRQTVAGLPVYGRVVQVNMDADRQPVQVLNGYEPALRNLSVPLLRRSRAQAAADARASLVGNPATVEVEEEMLTPDGRRVWRVMAIPAGGMVEWELLVDAATGALAYAFERSTHGLHDAPAGPASPNMNPSFALHAEAAPAPRTVARVDGSGFVFIPDPLTSAGVPYGGAFVDANDATNAQLDAQRVLVTLPEISFSQNRYTLDGPYVRIIGQDPSGQTVYTPPQEAQPDGFRYTREQDGFEAVMVYYHTDLSQRRVQALDVGRAVLERSVPINPHGYEADDSRFFPSSGRIYFGTGAIDDAEDAGVIWHEYAHAILHDGQPALYQASDGTGLHEGWADYWAASYRRGLIEAGTGAGDWRQVFPWDGNNGCWQGRRLDHTGRWPDATAYPAQPGCPAIATFYQKGLLWATTLMEVYDALGKDITDRLAVASHPFIGVVPGVSAFETAAEALVAADQALYRGAYRSVLLGVLGARGYLDPETYGPVVAHTPLASTEQAGGTLPLEVEARGPGAAIEAVTVFYRYDEGELQSRTLDAQGDSHYTGALPLPTTSATVTYAVEARDARGRVTRLPANPAEVFEFTAGPDIQPPAIAHVPRDRVPLAAWPLTIEASVTDNLGVDTVTVDFVLYDAQNAEEARGTFGLVRAGSTRYAASWPIPASQLGVGSTLRYVVRARDTAVRPNTSRTPQDGTFQTMLVAQGVLAAFSFESEGDGVVATGAWERGTPAYGLPRARTGANAWMTTRAGAYPDTRSTSLLELPPLDLRGDPPLLVFWHWYDLERAGQCQTLCDGAAVEVSTDGGVSWQEAVPVGGYPDTVDARTNTDLSGRGAWGGYSHGWQRAVVPLPAQPDVRVRFILATDAGNIYPTRYGYAGWALDDVEITTLLPKDALPPYLEAEPATQRVKAAGLSSVPFAFDVRDETGVARVQVAYAYGSGMETRRDTLRLEQSLEHLDRFTGTLMLPTPVQPGDVLVYTLVLEDPGGNRVVYPREGGYEVRYRTIAQAELLLQARSTGQWRPSGTLWEITPSAAVPGVSTLVLPPQDLPANAETISFVLDHVYRLEEGVGGEVRASVDGGATWQALEPVTGYPARLALPGHPRDGAAGYAGTDTLESVFDLTPLGGQQVRLRLDFVAQRALAAGEFWAVRSFVRYTDTDDDSLDVPRAFALHALQPHPVRAQATFAYTLEKAGSVTLEVFDLLGRRVAVLIEGREQGAGTYAETFDASSLSSGTYVLRLRASGRQQTRRVVVLR